MKTSGILFFGPSFRQPARKASSFNLIFFFFFVMYFFLKVPLFSPQVQADPNRIVVSGQNLAATAVGKPSYFTIANVTGSVEDVEINVEGQPNFLHKLTLKVFTIRE